MPRTKTKPHWLLTSVALTDAWTDFILSRQVMQCTPATLTHYHYTAGMFLQWIERQGLTSPDQVTARHVRAYLADVKGSDGTKRDHARAVKTLLRFWHREGYIPSPVLFDLPRASHKRQPVLSAAQLVQIVQACNTRDKAIVLFLADSGLRRQEAINLDWSDIDMTNGLVRVIRGKGRKDRSAVIGATTRRALLAYRRTLQDRDGALFRTRSGERFSGQGMLRIFRTLSARTGIRVTVHAMRRTFVILSLRSGMDVLHLQALLGHAGLQMVQHYAQMIDEDLLQAHRQHSPVDNLDRLK